MTGTFAIELGGVRLVAAEFDRLTVDQDGWISAKLERAGVSDPALHDLEPKARKREVRLRILESGQVGPILAGFFVVEGEPWSTEAAQRHAQQLRGVTDATHRAVLFAAVDGFVQSFFGGGERSETVTGKPSPMTGEADRQLPASSAALTADTGIPSSEPCGDSIPSESPGDSAGPSETPLPLTSSI